MVLQPWLGSGMPNGENDDVQGCRFSVKGSAEDIFRSIDFVRNLRRD